MLLRPARDVTLICDRLNNLRRVLWMDLKHAANVTRRQARSTSEAQHFHELLCGRPIKQRRVFNRTRRRAAANRRAGEQPDRFARRLLPAGSGAREAVVRARGGIAMKVEQLDDARLLCDVNQPPPRVVIAALADELELHAQPVNWQHV